MVGECGKSIWWGRDRWGGVGNSEQGKSRWRGRSNVRPDEAERGEEEGMEGCDQ